MERRESLLFLSFCICLKEINRPLRSKRKKKKKNLKAEGILFCLVSLSLSPNNFPIFFFQTLFFFFLVFMCQVQKLLLALFGNRNAYIKCYTHYLPPPIFL